MKTLLITGFEPFGGQPINPAWEAVAALPDVIGDWQLVKLRIPVEYGWGAACLLRKAAEVQPDAILSIGQAGGNAKITPEVVGINLRETGAPDNAGVLCSGTAIVRGGRDAYFATLPVREMVLAMKQASVPAALSYTAGAYVCNDVLYTVLHRYHGTGVRVGFVHVPFLPEQAKEGVPSLPLEDIVRGLTAAIAVL